MTINFEDKERKVIEIESYNKEPFAGYIAPNGDLIDYTQPFGESGHDGWDNIVSNKFLAYISYIVKGTSIYDSEEKEDLMYPGIDEYVIRGLSSVNKNRKTIDELIAEVESFFQFPSPNSPMDRLCHDLMLFFKRAYSNKTFFETIDKKIYATSEETFMKSTITKLKERYPDNKQFQDNYNKFVSKYQKMYLEHLKSDLMSHFKDIAIMYLGYDSIERFDMNGKLIKIPDDDDYISFCRSEPDTYFYKIPRIITTSYNNINERFYNFLLMDWNIRRVPKYFWNPSTQKYECESQVYRYSQNENEEILEKEITSIRKLVPKNKRYKYFR